jgi:1,4-alpha-glucan branching enzyme
MKKHDQAIYFFHQGTNFHSYRFLGCHFENANDIHQATFRVWAPNAKKISVVGDFNGWNHTANPMKKLNSEGIWETTINHVYEYNSYKYQITSLKNETYLKADPFAFYSETMGQNSSKAVRLDGFLWQDDTWSTQHTNHYNQPMNIYEVNFGSWRKYCDGQYFDYRKLAEELIPYVKEMGYTHIEVMPLTEFPYDGSWGYQVTGYFSITSRYGTPHDFMHFVNECHKNGIGVILDWVPAHFPKDEFGLIEFDGTYQYESSSWSKMEHKTWGTRLFDFGRPEIQSFLISSATFFLDIYHIDGLRVDAVSSMLYLDYDRNPGEWIPNSFGDNRNLEGIAFIQKCNQYIHNAFSNRIMIAEESTAFENITVPVHEGGLGFHYKWNMGWMNDILRYMKTDPLYRGSLHQILTFSMVYAFNEKYILPISHDEVVHGKYSLLNKMPGDYDQKFAGLRTFLVYMMTHPGKKVHFMGYEFGQFIEWDYRKELDWMLLSYDKHRQTQQFVKDMNHFYLDNKSLWDIDYSWDGYQWVSYEDTTHNILSFRRIGTDKKDIIVLLNFSFMHITNYWLMLPKGKYEVIFSSSEYQYGGYQNMKGNQYQTFVSNHHNKAHFISIDIPQISAFILRKIK